MLWFYQIFYLELHIIENVNKKIETKIGPCGTPICIMDSDDNTPFMITSDKDTIDQLDQYDLPNK